jgi:hypothetical protein
VIDAIVEGAARQAGRVLLIVFLIGLLIGVATVLLIVHAAADSIPIKEPDKAAYQALFFRVLADQARLQGIVEAFLQQNPEAKRLQADYNETTAKLGELEPTIYKNAGLSKTEYAIDGEKGVFVQRPSTAAKPTENQQ